MNTIIYKYEGKDLIIPQETLKKMGIQPGQSVRLVLDEPLQAVDIPQEEMEKRKALLLQLWGDWSAEDEDAFNQARQEMWSQWQPPNLS